MRDQTYKYKFPFREMIWPCLIVVLAILIYGYSLNNGFIWDDDAYVYQNPFVSSWAGLQDIWYASKTIQYYPLTFSSFWLEHKLYGGFFPTSHHIFNLTLHILNALLLLSLLRKIAPRFSGIIALLFTIHPIQVETVAWITERKNLLGFFFFLLAFHAFLNFEKTRKKMAYAKILLLFIAALLSKTMSVCFATVPLLYVWWKKGSISKNDWFRSLPFFLTAGIFGFVTIHFERTYAGAENVLSITAWERIIFASKIFFFYLKQILLPWKFMFFYPKWDIQKIDLHDWLLPLSIFGLFSLLFLKRHQWGRGSVALLCFYIISIFPALGFFDLYPMRFSYVADHFSYFSIPAVLLLFCAATKFSCEKMASSLSRFHWKISNVFKKSLLSLLVVFLSLLSFRLTWNYKDQMTLWHQLLLQNPRATLAYNNLAILLENPDDTILLLKKALQIEPQASLINLNLGKAYEKKGDYEDAIRFYKLASQGVDPYAQVFHYRLIAAAYLRQNNLAEAISWLEKAIVLLSHPEYQKQRRAFLQMKNFDPSEEVMLYADLGALYFSQGNNSKAAEAFKKASFLNPKDESFRKNLTIAKTALETSKKKELY